MAEGEPVDVRPDVRFTVLRGTVAAQAGGRAVTLGGPQQRRLLAALLASHDSVVSADRLVESVWSHEDAPDGARRTVMSYVSRLRSSIGQEYVLTREHGYELVLGGASFDATDFEVALAEARAATGPDAVELYDRALGYWSGRAYGEDADEWWLQPVAARLEELRLLALGERAQALIDDGRHDDAVLDLQVMVADQPLREHFVALLMRALYLGGRQADALRTFQRFREYLADETGLDPSADLIELDRRIVQGDPTLAPGSSLALPGYELTELIGEGAFGSVYRAVQPSVGREVAVKVVRRELADDPRFVRRFESEAQLVARIEHPHVVPLYDFWRRPGGAFLVFRLLRGGSLADRVAGGPLSLGEASRLVGELGSALTAAHALGVVHRDVKPANILFDESDNSYLSDFGIAQLGPGDETLDVRSAGSPLYASPEQFRDEPASPASDQYSFAVVIWEALSGRAPFSGTTATELGMAKLRQSLPALDAAVDGAVRLGPVLAKATAPHPADRYPSVAEFVAAWHVALRDGDVAITTTGPLSGRASAPPAGQTVANLGLAGVNPYKGLRSFQEADAGEFCGRDELVERLVARIGCSPFVAVVGPSGSGKSSLVHAGVVPALRRDGALVVSMTPGNAPMVELRCALGRVATADDEESIDVRLARAEGLAELAGELVGPGGRLVLVVDQLEELWTLTADRHARDHFADLLACASDHSDRLRVVVTLRADQYDLPLQHPALGPVVSESTFAVTPMSASELHDAIVLPAERVGVRFEDQLVPTMVGDVLSRPGALPLLQFALTELFERRHGASITRAGYEELGGIGGAIARRAEALFDATVASRRSDVHRLFTQLVTTGDDADDLRRRATIEELSDLDPDVIEAYLAARLLVTDHDPVTREPTIEVAHEALLREWPRLVEWIAEDRDVLRVRRGLSLAATEWHTDPADESTLLRGTRLAAADEVARTLTLTHGELAFLQASHELADRERRQADERAAAQARQNRRLRRVLTGTAALLVVALLAGGFALQQRRRSDRNAAEATQSRIVADSRSLAPTDRDVSLLLAAEAARREPGLASANALATALLTDQAFLRYEGDPDASRASTNGLFGFGDVPTFSPDGQQLAVPDSTANVIRIVDVVTGENRRELEFPPLDVSVVLGMSWLADGVLVLYAENEVVGIDAATGAVRMPAQAMRGVTSWAVSADGRRAAVVANRTGSPAVSVIDLRSGDLLMQVAAPCCSETPLGTFEAAVAWSGNDLYVASRSGTVQQLDPVTGETVRTLGTGFPAPASIVFVDGGETLVISGRSSDGTAQMMAFDAETGLAVWDETVPVWAAAIAEDPRHHAIVVTDVENSGVLRRFDVATGETDVATFDPQTGPPCIAVTSPDGRYLAAASCTRSRVALWSLAGAGAAFRYLAESRLSLDGAIFNRDASYAVLSGVDAALDPSGPTELDLATGELTHVELPSAFTSAAQFTPTHHVALLTKDGRLALSVDEVDRPAAGFAMAAPLPTQLDGLPTRTDQLGDVTVVQYASDTHRLWVTATPDLTDAHAILYDPGDIGGFSITPTGDRLLVSGTEGVREYDVATGRLIDQPFSGNGLASDRDRRVLVVAGLDGTIVIRDAATLAPTGSVIAASPNPTIDLAPDGSLLKVVDGSRRMQLYDVATQSAIGPPVDLGEGSDSEILPDGDSMLVQRDGSIVELGLDPAIWLDAACLAAGRNLTIEEWAAYIGGSPRSTCPQWPAPVSSVVVPAPEVTPAAASAPSSTVRQPGTAPQPDKGQIVARGNLPPSEDPIYGAASEPGGPQPFTATYTLEGDLTGSVTIFGTMLLDDAAGTFTQFETVGTFTGSLVGVGDGTLVFTTSVPTTPFGALTVETGTVGEGTGALAGFEGTIEMRFQVNDDMQPIGTYVVTLESTSR